MSNSPPSTLGQYQIIREIARSNDIVYEAYDPLMNRRVAIKELMMPSGSTPQQQEDRTGRFKREAQAAGTLNHPNIMTVYSFAEDAGHTFMAMEFLDGQTLRNELDARGSISVDRAVEIAASVLSGLEHAHSKGVIHRDIKPDNIQILSNGQIKITDFGIARLTFQPNLTIDGQVFGTPSYMSPEQVVGRDIDARSDIFSVGVMLFEMIAGHKPFSGDSVVSTTYAIMNKDPLPEPAIPWAIWSVIERALEKSPAMRWTSAAEMKEALEGAADPTTGVMPVVDPNVPAGYSAATNPYATPPPLPVPYNPYGQQPGPYAGQYGQPPAQAPLTYPYNPYQGGAGYPPGQPGMQPGFVPSIYAPPQPRPALIKPEQVLFVKRVFLAVLIIGALFGLIFTAVVALLYEANQYSQPSVNAADQQRAKALADQASKDVQNQEYSQAEKTLNDAISTDPGNPELLAKEAQVFFDRAQRISTAPEKATLYQQSASEYDKAWSAATSPDKKQKYMGMYALACYNFAGNALVAKAEIPANELRVARSELERARPLVAQGDPLYRPMTDLWVEYESLPN